MPTSCEDLVAARATPPPPPTSSPAPWEQPWGLSLGLSLSHPTLEREKSSLTRSVLSHTSISSMTEGCTTGIYGGGKQWPAAAQPGEGRQNTKVNHQHPPPNETKHTAKKTHQHSRNGQRGSRAMAGGEAVRSRSKSGGWGRGEERGSVRVLDMENSLTVVPGLTSQPLGPGSKNPLLSGVLPCRL